MNYKWEVEGSNIPNINNVPARISFYPSSNFLINQAAYYELGLTEGDGISLIYKNHELFISRSIEGDEYSLNIHNCQSGIYGYYRKKIKKLGVYDKSFLLTDLIYSEGRRMYRLEPSEIRQYQRNK